MSDQREPHTEQMAAEHTTPVVEGSTLGECEPWDAWESKLVGWSLGIGVAGLIVLGVIINITILD